jgi:thioredoxin
VGKLPASFFELIEDSMVPVLVDFWAEWCGPCKAVTPAVERLAREYRGRLLAVKINVDRKPGVAARYEVEAIPTIMLFWKGEPVMRLQGARPYADLRSALEAHWPQGLDG